MCSLVDRKLNFFQSDWNFMCLKFYVLKVIVTSSISHTFGNGFWPCIYNIQLIFPLRTFFFTVEKGSAGYWNVLGKRKKTFGTLTFKSVEALSKEHEISFSW